MDSLSLEVREPEIDAPIASKPLVGEPDRDALPDRLSRLFRQRTIALIRADSFELGEHLAKVAIAAGLTTIEIAWNGVESARSISTLCETFPDCAIGAGTVLSADSAKDAIAAGAQFLFSPHTDPATIEAAQTAEIPVIPGALTPTEIQQARAAGATAVKIFPIAAVGGVNYLRALRAPLPHVPLIPTGGVTIAAAADYIEAGAVAVALSNALFPAEAIRRRDWDAIETRIRDFVADLSRFSPR